MPREDNGRSPQISAKRKEEAKQSEASNGKARQIPRPRRGNRGALRPPQALLSTSSRPNHLGYQRAVCYPHLPPSSLSESRPTEAKTRSFTQPAHAIGRQPHRTIGGPPVVRQAAQDLSCNRAGVVPRGMTPAGCIDRMAMMAYVARCRLGARVASVWLFTTEAKMFHQPVVPRFTALGVTGGMEPRLALSPSQSQSGHLGGGGR